MTASDDKPADDQEAVALLKSRVNELADPVTPAVNRATDQAKQYAQQTQAVVADRTDDLSAMIRQSPLAVMAIACAVGYLIGRIVR